MSCSVRFETIVMFAGGELSAEESAQFEAHLRTCESCASRLESVRGMQTCLQDSLREPVAHPDLVASVMSQIPMADASATRRTWSWAYAAACVVVALAVGFGIVLSRPGSEPTQTDRPSIVQIEAPHSNPSEESMREAETSDVRDTQPAANGGVVWRPSPHKPALNRPVAPRQPKVAQIPDPERPVQPKEGSDEPVICIHVSTVPEHDAASDDTRLSEITTVVVAGESVTSITTRVSPVEKPVPVNKHVAWRPPLEPERKPTDES